ncbi:peroxide stress protein YaaA [Actinomycetaceae bacterium MB13-C1-2]|nr:peroxide stress protein YaaA [Actinomycetaceae bacterium MB13-C1-2]
MLILLPPSEGKTSPTAGPRFSLESISFPELTGARSRVIQTLQELGNDAEAVKTLGLGKKSAEEASLNLSLFDSHCSQAINLYTGVLYDHLNTATLDKESRGRLSRQALISSALFGLIRPDDLIPNHRLAIGVRLPEIGAVGPWWRRQIEQASSTELDLQDRAVFDARSGGYKAAFSVCGANVVELSVVEERAAGRKVITHMAKKWRGLAARHLVQDNSLTDSSTAGEILGSLKHMALASRGLGVVGLEVSEPKPTKGGGSVVEATLVTTSTEKT